MIPGGGQGDMAQLLKQAQKMQQDLMAAQQRLASAQVVGSAGGGLVRATVTGAGELVGLEIDPKVVDPEDAETLADLVLAAVRDATAAASRLQADTMGPLTQGISGIAGGLPGLPGMPGGPGLPG